MRFRKNAFLLSIVIALAGAHVVAESGERRQGMSPMNIPRESRIRLLFDGKETVVRVNDHPTTRDFLSRLPMTLDFKDYIGKEKIAYLPSKLSSDGSSPMDSGDFAYYAPWGNLAIFYRGSERAGGGLIVLGTIESGKSNLASMQSDFTMTIERID